MTLVFFFAIYVVLLRVIFIYECSNAICDPDETFDKTHGLYSF